jgi:CubicO group peptidase (beta-lactamase class C family)
MTIAQATYFPSVIGTIILACAVIAPSSASAQAIANEIPVPLAGAAATPADITRQVEKMVVDLKLEGAAVIIGRSNGRGGWSDVVRTYVGGYGPQSVEAVASTTKWFTAAAVASVVESGKLGFDKPLTQCFTKLPRDKQAITLRQTLAHISGLPALSPMAERKFADLEESAANVLSLPLVGTPGKVMQYSGTAYQVAARCAEVADGRDFRALFDARIAGPLKLARTRFGNPAGAPTTGGGLGSSPADLETFSKMMAGRGVVDGVRVLKASTVDDMARLISKDAQVLDIPGAARGYAGMGTGVWCERADTSGSCQSIASVGAFGTYAWADYERGEYGVLFIRGSLPQAMPWWRGIRSAAEQIARRAPPPQHSQTASQSTSATR